MHVTQGISTEYSKEKFAILLDETDLIRLMNEYGIEQEPEKLTTVQAMLLLTTEAERFVLVQAPKYGKPVEDQPDGTKGIRTLLAENREQFVTALTLATGWTLEESRKRAGLEPKP